MTTRAEQFAVRFEAVNDEVMTKVSTCSDEQWQQPSASEGWPVAVVAHHIGVVHGDFIGLLKAFAAGETRSPGDSMAGVHESNAQHARDHAAVGKPETLDLLRTNGAAVAALIRSFSDEQLERIAGVFGGNELSVAQVVEYVVIGHAAEHLASLRTTLADGAVHAG